MMQSVMTDVAAMRMVRLKTVTSTPSPAPSKSRY